MNTIQFGTDGWRGVIAEDFTFANARTVAHAIARYVVRNEAARKGVLSGYGHRWPPGVCLTPAKPQSVSLERHKIQGELRQQRASFHRCADRTRARNGAA